MGPFAYINLSTVVATFIFIIFLHCIYFSKKNMKNIENKIYTHLLIWTGLTVGISVLFQIVIFFTENIPFLIFLTKLWYGFVDSWVLLLVFYIVVVANEKREKLYSFFNKMISFLLLYFCIVIVFIVELLLPLTISMNHGEFSYSGGLCMYFYYIFILFFMMVAVVTVVINKKNINKKKVSPFYLMMVLGFIAIVVAFILPQYAIIQIFFTLAVYLMFFTIENPDIKVISELEFARDQAEKANNAKSDFLSSMSHELRTPLNAIVGLSQLIRDRSEDVETKNDANDIYKASNSLLDIVDGILEVNKLDTNNIEIVNRDYSFIDVINSINDKSQLLIGDKPVTFKLKVSEDIPKTLYGDKDKIRIIVDNLVSNAIKYTDEGSVELSIDCLNSKDRCNLRINVSDTGKGISEEDINNIFNKFYRGEDNKDSDISGAGLGLSITKSLVELMDGKINVNSNEGEGTTFLVTLSQKIVEDNNQDTEIL